ncbi:GumC family protein [Gellertiella hungarica]|uniref:Exopolysaccharide transport family protein n=1 Tax=Gellertiella hungarica TaxID=1572859 RepID=A0A7W6JB10_9HYPH|nr:Wzz/FepE/Etk N-terminal domain-containing protein [Gellertiella hungarica]MBB4067116.1 exopolysaccharide transport family protein [Gellertiella hungarica]
MPDGTVSQQDVDIDLKQLLGAIWQRRLRILALTATVSALAFVGANLATPSYQSEARLLIEPRAPAFSKTEQAGGDTQPLLDELNIASQVQVLSSADLIKRVASELNLSGLSEFDSSRSLSTRILRALHLKKADTELTPEERVVDKFIEKLQVYQVEKSRVIGIQFNSEDPKLAAAIPNTMMKIYSLMQSDAKIDSNFEATQWLEPEIATLRQKVQEAEKKVADYRAMKDIPQSGDTGSLAAQQLKDISTELARVRSDGASATARAAAVRNALASGGSADTLADIANSALMQKLKETEANLKAQIADLSTTLLNSHPRLKALRSQLGGVQVQIRQETTKILSSIENEAKVAKLREEELVRQLDAAKVDAARTSEQEVGLKALEREANAQRQLLETYLARYREAASRSGKNSSPADARVISNAIEPREPTFPKILPITIIAGLATFILSAVTILLMELFSGRALKPAVPLIPREEDVTVPARAEKAPRMPDPLPMPAVEAPAAKPVDAPPPAAVAEAPPVKEEEVAIAGPEAEVDGDYSIEAVARHITAARIPVAFGLSPTGDDGSTSMVMLARQIAEIGPSVILIDMTSTLLPTRLMAADRYLPGITDLLTGDAAFGETIHSDRLSNAHVVPRGRAELEEAMRGAERLSIIIGALSDAYDVVLVECGQTTVEALARLTRNPSEHIVLSMPVPDEEMLATLIGDCADAGYSELMLMADPRATAPKGWLSRMSKGQAA